MKWAVLAAAYVAGFLLYALTPDPVDEVVLALYITLIVASMLIPLRGDSTSKAASAYLRLFVVQAIVFSILLFLIPLSSFFQSDVTKYEGAALVILPTFFFVSAPGLRLSRLGDYLRRYGLEGIVKRSSFGTRDDHFILDYSIGRWFQHASFALGYAGLLAVYFLGWFLLIGILWLPLSASLIVFALAISKRSAKRLLSPYDPMNVAPKNRVRLPSYGREEHFTKVYCGYYILLPNYWMECFAELMAIHRVGNSLLGHYLRSPHPSSIVPYVRQRLD